MPLDDAESRLASGYLQALGFPLAPEIAVARNWQDAETVLRSHRSADFWWDVEESERKRLTLAAARRVGGGRLPELLTAAAGRHAQETFACALASCGDEALAKVASGAALAAIHQHELALHAGCEASHVFMQKYDLFAGGRFPLGLHESRFTFF
ncbi:MAG TPA: hypothetical protein VHB46_08430 [Burkholderiales bacterium]|nr:hypothetical protein [Burkholderiales bacterium]